MAYQRRTPFKPEPAPPVLKKEQGILVFAAAAAGIIGAACAMPVLRDLYPIIAAKSGLGSINTNRMVNIIFAQNSVIAAIAAFFGVKMRERVSFGRSVLGARLMKQETGPVFSVSAILYGIVYPVLLAMALIFSIQGWDRLFPATADIPVNVLEAGLQNNAGGSILAVLYHAFFGEVFARFFILTLIVYFFRKKGTAGILISVLITAVLFSVLPLQVIAGLSGLKYYQLPLAALMKILLFSGLSGVYAGIVLWKTNFETTLLAQTVLYGVCFLLF